MTEVLRRLRNSNDTPTVPSEDQSEIPEKKPKIDLSPTSKKTPSTPEKSDDSKKGMSSVLLEDNQLTSVFFPRLISTKDKKDESKLVTQNTVSDPSKPKVEKSENPKEVEIEFIETSNGTKPGSPKPGPSNYTPQIKKKPKFKKNSVISSSIELPTTTTVPVFPRPTVAYPTCITPVYTNGPPLWDMITNFPKSISNDFQKFHSTMCLWRWHKLDGCDLVVVKRPNMELIPASIVQIKMLSRFATNIVQNIPENSIPKMVSHKMTPAEAWMLNFVNATVCNFNLGLQIFVNGDDLVEVSAVERYYWAVKKIHLEHLLMIYSGELPPGSLFENKNLVGAIINLKKTLVDEIKKSTFKQIELSF